MAYEWQFGVLVQYQGAFWSGLWVTLALSGLAILAATILGTLLAVADWLARGSLARTGVRAVVELFRSVPVIVLLVWMYYALPILTGVQLPAFATAVTAISLVSGAFIAEILRAGMEAIPKGQIEAARLLGFSELQTLQHVVLPQAFRRNLPALMGEYVTTIKTSSLSVLIGVNELLYQTTNASSLSFRPVELYTFLGILFLAIILPLSYLSKRLEFQQVLARSNRKTKR